MVDDGFLIALAGIRMTVRNLILVRALRDGIAFDEVWYRDAVQHEFRALAAEKRADATRVGNYLSSALDRDGRASHSTDYRWMDADALERRGEVLDGLAARLDAAAEDDEIAATLVHSARDAAMDDIATAVQPAQGATVGSTKEERASVAKRKSALVEDLMMLHLEAPL